MAGPKPHPSTLWRCHHILGLPVPPDICDPHPAGLSSERFGLGVPRLGRSSPLGGLDPGQELSHPAPTSELSAAACSAPSLGWEPIPPFLRTSQSRGHFLPAPSSGRLRQRGAQAGPPGGPGAGGPETEGRERAKETAELVRGYSRGPGARGRGRGWRGHQTDQPCSPRPRCLPPRKSHLSSSHKVTAEGGASRVRPAPQ